MKPLSLLFLLLITVFSCQKDKKAISMKPTMSAVKVDTLTLHKVLSVNGLEDAQLSGLTIKNGVLYTVSDKRDTVLYKIELGEKDAAVVPHLTFTPPAHENDLDLEGITHDADNFYLMCEDQFQILKVNAKTSEASWASTSYYGMCKEEGFFGVNNAYFEGITKTGESTFVMAMERQPRGLLDVNLSFDEPSSRIVKMDYSKFKSNKAGAVDFAGLYYYNNRLFALQRNAYLISEMEPTNSGYNEGDAWSYRHVALNERYHYSNMKYGHAEGLAIDKDYIYIILDNNNTSRLVDKNDKRPLLFIFNNPGL